MFALSISDFLGSQQVDVSLDPGPGCEIGGIIGWRTKQGRRGLGGPRLWNDMGETKCTDECIKSYQVIKSWSTQQHVGIC